MTNSTLSVWHVKESDFPHHGSLQKQLKFLLHYAILAPSGHNSQPWQFAITDRHLEILPNFDYARPAVDPDHRELFISLGAAATNLSLAADHFGLIYEKNYDLKPASQRFAITFDFKTGRREPIISPLFAAITNRQTNRFAYSPRPVSGQIIDTVPADYHPDVEFNFIKKSADKNTLAALVYKSNLLWHQSQELVDEFQNWLRDDLVSSDDGLPLNVINFYKLAANIDCFRQITDPAIITRARHDQKIVTDSPLLVIVASRQDNIATWIKTGESYEMLALHLTSHSLAHAFFNNVVELRTMRRQLAQSFCHGCSPQLILRVGYPTVTPPHTPRRPAKIKII